MNHGGQRIRSSIFLQTNTEGNYNYHPSSATGKHFSQIPPILADVGVLSLALSSSSTVVSSEARMQRKEEKRLGHLPNQTWCIHCWLSRVNVDIDENRMMVGKWKYHFEYAFTELFSVAFITLKIPLQQAMRRRWSIVIAPISSLNRSVCAQTQTKNDSAWSFTTWPYKVGDESDETRREQNLTSYLFSLDHHHSTTIFIEAHNRSSK